jgi:4-hydroxy-tetrahydrodipicolinate synthase
MAMSQFWRGIFPIVVTPFTPSYELDEESLRKVIRFCIEAGVHGLVGPAMASEFSTLSDDERRRWIEIVVAETSGQVPVVAATTAGHAVPAVALSRYAQNVGADGIIALPPPIQHPNADGCYAYYQAIAEAVTVPIIVQNAMGPTGTPMSSQLLARMCRELPQVQYVKEETVPQPLQISATLAATGAECKGVFGGNGGMHMLDEHRRGAAGNMPGCQVVDVQVRIWNLLESGDDEGARKIFNRFLPLISFERVYKMPVYKEILYRRGVIATTLSRTPGKDMDELARTELERLLADVEPLYCV